MIVAHNLAAMNTQRQFNINRKSKAKSAEKLASGYRINRSADDAAGLSISEKMRRQIRGLSQGVKNSQDGVSLCQVADGALAEVSDMLHRITELSVKAANGTNTELDRQYIQEEISQLLEEIDRVSDRTTFNDRKIFDGSMAIPVSEASEEITHEMARKQLLSGNYFQFDEGTVSVNGTDVSSDETNAYIACLSQYVIEDDIYSRGLNYAGPNNQTTTELVESLKNIVHVNYDIVDGDKDSPYYQMRIDSLDKAAEVLETADADSALRLYQDLTSVFFPGLQNTGGMYEAFYTHSVTGYASHAYGMLDTLQTEAYDYSQGQTTSPYFQYGEAAKINTIGYKGTINQALDGPVVRGEVDFDSQGDAVEQYMKLLQTSFLKSEDSGAYGVYIQSGAEPSAGILLGIDEMNTEILGIKGLDVSTVKGAEEAMDAVKLALHKVSTNRSKIGAQQNRLEYTIANGNNIVENTTAAESRIRDTDMAKEMVKLAKDNILEQAGNAMMAQANQSNQGVLSLLG